ncbi:MAG TPA: hypothetical protein PLU50_11655 [Pseudobdellovibrionaceae bacterium]|nr:hypothetical protein [Pseudobdellovibrionaceae bacterium]
MSKLKQLATAGFDSIRIKAKWFYLFFGLALFGATTVQAREAAQSGIQVVIRIYTESNNTNDPIAHTCQMLVLQDWSKVLSIKEVQSDSFFRNFMAIIQDGEFISSNFEKQNPSLKAAVGSTFDQFSLGTKDLNLFDVSKKGDEFRSKLETCNSNQFKSSVQAKMKQK